MEKLNYPRKEYHHLFARSIAPGDRYCELLPYRSLELERQPNLGLSPVYRLVLYRYGKAHYEGIRYVDRVGSFVGKFMINDFGKICYMIDILEIEKLRNNYRGRGTDRASTIVRLVREDGTEKIIEDYGNAGPIGLWTLQQVIDSVGGRIHWSPIQALP